ncbi:MAG: hypothetical protein R3E79_57655 [Caldilineaceae bacterium]
MSNDVKELSDEEVLAQIIQLGFGGDQERFATFCTKLHTELPPGTGIALRGSVVTSERWQDGAPFDAEGVGTSDLDVTLIGDAVMNCWTTEAFYLPGLHTKPLSDKDPNCARALNRLRQELQELVGRPVNFQATKNLVLFAHDVLLGQPYFMLIKPDTHHDHQTAQL